MDKIRAEAMDDLQCFIATKFHEFLALWFLNDQSHEPVKHQILDIAKFGTYRDASEWIKGAESINVL